ncbi:hypothetical protein L195_g041352 [Trifolium pratense]|uniref:Uncharacterized protein n=1 Tax=Trifolium pratense TaxID=57577 RepID=A0A2K3M3D7_TRIPR|nr:hypothetical protein L195_g041352 [Trifolium pratense]
MAMIEAFTDDREEIRIKETYRESETILIAERLETTERQINEKEQKMNESRSTFTLEDSTLLTKKQMACDPTMVPPPPPNSVNPLIAISQRGQLPEPQDYETVTTVTTQPKSTDVNLFIVVGGVSVTNRVKSWKSEMKVERRRPHSSDLRPPSKPPDVEGETDIELNNHHHGMPRPPSKPPDLNKSVDREREGKLRVEKRRTMRMNMGEPSSKSSEPPYTGDNSIHVRDGIVAEVEKILKKVRAKRTFDELSGSFNLMSQTPAIFCLILEEIPIWAGIKLVGFNESKGTLNKGVGIVDGRNLREKDRGLNWSCCKFGLTVNQMSQAQNNPSMWDRGLERWTVMKNLKLAHFLNDIYALNHVAHKQRDFLREEFVLANSFADDHLHVSKYGVHQNCFTFTVILILTSFISFAPQFPGVFDSLVQLGIHEVNHLIYGIHTYAFRSDRVIPLIIRIVAASDSGGIYKDSYYNSSHDAAKCG